MPYNYRLLAIDDAGLQSSSGIHTIQPLTNTIIDGVQNLSASFAPSLGRVYVKWSYPLDHKLYGFKIYRSLEDGSPYYFDTVIYNREDVTVDADDSSTAIYTYKDLDIYPFKTASLTNTSRMIYWVQAEYVNGASSELGQGVMVMKP